MKSRKLELKIKWMFLLFLFCLITNVSLAGPFGLAMGMKKDEIDSDLKEIDTFIYEVEEVKKPHKTFVRYEVWIGLESGICRIRAYSRSIATTRDGQELREVFQNLETRLKKLYGVYEKIDKLQAGSMWRDSMDWMMALVFKERRFLSEWNATKGAILTPDLAKIELIANADGEYAGQILLQYTFENFEQCQSEFNKAEDDTL